MNKKRIVITGGPGTGKTVLISSLEENGFYCFHEVIRTMTLEALNGKEFTDELVNPIAFVNDSKSFNDQLLNARLNHFIEAQALEEKHVFYDRGLPDVLAYMDYFKQSYDQGFIDICTENRYDEVLILPPWEAIYVQDNERMEDFKQSCDIHDHLEAKYTELGYNPIEVPFGPIEERMRFVLQLIDETGG
ncbi:AAA family ATPase [Maribacter sp. X9]|uniref:AAA family ATPase n=1 Tax=Maribacter sp. X9 TaxID=3402159 RepID=UPI003AF38BE1